VGGSTGGAVGALSANGFNISRTRVAKAVEKPRVGVAAFGVARWVRTIALGVTRELFAGDTDDSVEAVVAIVCITTLGVGGEVAIDGVVTTISLVAPVGELGISPVGLDDGLPLSGCAVASAPVL